MFNSRTARLNASFWFLDVFYLAAGAALVAVSIFFRSSDKIGTNMDNNTLRRLVLSDSDLNGGLILGVIILLSWLFSIPGYITSRGRNERGATTTGLAIFAWTLVFSVLANVIVGVALWFFTLRERVAFESVWKKQSSDVQAALQDHFKCCGYWDATAEGLFTSPTGFCANTATVITQGCVGPVTSYADILLNDIFTTIFAFMVIQVFLFLTTVCVINDRHDEERFRRIDEKRGTKGGFV